MNIDVVCALALTTFPAVARRRSGAGESRHVTRGWLLGSTTLSRNHTFQRYLRRFITNGSTHYNCTCIANQNVHVHIIVTFHARQSRVLFLALPFLLYFRLAKPTALRDRSNTM